MLLREITNNSMEFAIAEARDEPGELSSDGYKPVIGDDGTFSGSVKTRPKPDPTPPRPPCSQHGGLFIFPVLPHSVSPVLPYM